MKREKINKFAPQIDSELDLHGMSEAGALSAVSSFINKSESFGHNKVRIITGKGKGILQKAVREWLQEERRFFETAKITEGGAGAITVTL